MIEDKLLIFRFKQDHNGALRQIYDKYKIEMLKLAVVLTGDVNTAEDIVHDIFVRFAQSSRRIGITGNLRNYLITSVMNGVRNNRRSSNRHRAAGLEEANLHSSPERGPAQWAVLNERMSLLSEALQEVPYEQREVISLRMELDLPFRMIAKLQGASVNTVKGRYRYAITKLRSLLDSEVKI